MTEWALIVLLCSRFCVPQYVEIYASKTACESNLNTTSGTFRQERYCAPVVKTSTKQ
jgi:hypothetical protein